MSVVPLKPHLRLRRFSLVTVGMNLLSRTLSIYIYIYIRSPQGFKHWISSSTPSSFKSRRKKEETKFAFIHCSFI